MASNRPSFCWFVINKLFMSSGTPLLLSEPVCGRKERAENIFFFSERNLLSDVENQDSSAESAFFSASFSSFLAVSVAFGGATGFGLSSFFYSGLVAATGWFGFASLLSSLSNILRSSCTREDVKSTSSLVQDDLKMLDKELSKEAKPNQPVAATKPE
jgi:hypothetical protein